MPGFELRSQPDHQVLPFSMGVYTPEEAAVTSAVAVVGRVGQLALVPGLDTTAALDRGRVDQSERDDSPAPAPARFSARCRYR